MVKFSLKVLNHLLAQLFPIRRTPEYYNGNIQKLGKQIVSYKGLGNEKGKIRHKRKSYKKDETGVCDVLHKT